MKVALLYQNFPLIGNELSHGFNCPKFSLIKYIFMSNFSSLKDFLFSKSYRLLIWLNPFISIRVALFLENPNMIPWIFGFHHKCVLRTWYSWDGEINICANMVVQVSLTLIHMCGPCAGKWRFKNIHPTPLLHLFFLFGWRVLHSFSKRRVSFFLNKHPSRMIIEPTMVNKIWSHISISSTHLLFCCPFLDPRLYHPLVK